MRYLLPFGLAFALAGLCLLIRGRWPRRTGDTPHCRACGYPLTGLTDPARCPECGNALSPKQVIRGERSRRPRLAALGLLLLVAGLLPCGIAIRSALLRVNWYHYRPASWVLRDLESPALAGKAWDELQRRRAAGTLAPERQQELVDACLRVQAAQPANPLRDPMLDYLGELVNARLLPNAQRERFFDQAITMALRVRPAVGRGDRIPYSLGVGGRDRLRSAWNSQWDVEFSIDGELLAPYLGITGAPFGRYVERRLAAPRPLGHHVLRVQVLVRTVPDKPADASESRRGPPLYEHTYRLEATFDVMPERPAVRRVVDPAAALAVRGTVTLPYVAFAPRSGVFPPHLSGQIRVTRPPLDLAFDVIARTGGADYPMGRVRLARGEADDRSLRTDDFPDDVDEVTIMLRGSEAAVREDVDGDSYWDGEITLTPELLKFPAPKKTAPATRPLRRKRPATTSP